MTGREFDISSEIAGLDTERIISTLAAHKVSYVIVGGLAAIAHGSTLATADIDLVPDADPGNLERLLDALEMLDAKILISKQRQAMEDSEPWESTELKKGVPGLLSAEAWHFTTSAGPVDIVMTAAGVGPYEAHLDAVEEREVFNIRVFVAGIDDLVASKKALKRPKDQAVLQELMELRGEADG